MSKIDPSVSLKKTNLSIRTINALCRAGYRTVGHILGLSIAELYKIKNLGKKSAVEVLDLIDSCKDSETEKSDDEDKGEVIVCSKYDLCTKISDLYFDEVIGGRAYNICQDLCIVTLADVERIDINSITNIKGVGTTTINDFKYLKILFAEISSSSTIPEKISSLNPAKIKKGSEHFDKILQYFKERDLLISNQKLSTRAKRQLNAADVIYFTDLIKYDDISVIRNIGLKTIQEVNEFIINTYASHLNALNVICGLTNKNDIGFVKSEIIRYFQRKDFRGLNLNYFKKVLPEIDETILKKALGELVAENKIEYLDYKCYLKYPSFMDFISIEEVQKFLGIKGFELISKRMNGMTLEEVGAEHGVTRERIRQICVKSLKSVKNLLNQYGFNCFDEDYYAYLYEHYDLPKDFYELINIDERSKNYLKTFYTKGTTKINEALNDENVPISLRFKIHQYGLKDYAYINGEYIPLKRSSLFLAFAKKYLSTVQTKREDAINQYNTWIQNLLPDNNELLADTGSRTLVHIFDTNNFLTSEHQKVRYFDIESIDSEKLFSQLKLNRFENIYITTNLLFNENQALMEEYKIANQYELHNLLKRIIGENNDLGLKFLRMPGLQFGSFNDEDYILDIIKENPGISKIKLVNYISNNLGVLPYTVAYSWQLERFDKYYSNGGYYYDDVQNEIPQQFVQPLLSSLVKDLYRIDDVKKIYLEINSSGDPEDINKYSLAKIGLNTTKTFILQNYSTILEYFNHLLSGEITDLNLIPDFILDSSTFHVALYEQKRSRKVFVFKPRMLISSSRLEKFGITDDDITDFSNSVYSFIEDNNYYSFSQIVRDGFKHKLLDLGFDDIFYAGILAFDEEERFTCESVYGTYIFGRKNSELPIATRNNFISYSISKFKAISVDDIIDYLGDTYGVFGGDELHYRIICVANSIGYYYEQIMDKIYSNKNEYYKEIEG